MATRTNQVTTPRPGRNLSAWTEYNKSLSVNSYADGDTCRVDNQVAADYGRTIDVTLGAGTFAIRAEIETLASCQNAVVVVRRKSDYQKYFEAHVTTANSGVRQVTGSFTLTAPTTVTLLFGVGSYGVSSAGSAKFGKFLIESGTSAGVFFDGASPDEPTISYDWLGTAHASRSTATTGSTVPDNPPNSGGTDPALENMVRAVWEGYKYRYVRADGAVLQREWDNKVVSEGQAYAMLYAVQLDDRPTFDRVEAFNKSTLERRNWKPGGHDNWRNGGDNDPRLLAPDLLAWDFRPAPYASLPANSVYDWNFATDADVDRAKALFYAWRRWGDQAYLDKALAIAEQLILFGHNLNPANGWFYQVTDEYQQSGPITRTGRTPGHHQYNSGAEFEQNVSYIDVSFNHLAKDIGGDDRYDLATSGAYDTLDKVTDNLGGIPTTAGLPPDWNTYGFSDNDAFALTSGSRGWTNTRAIDFKFDAFRTVPRLRWALDQYGDTEALTILSRMKTWYQDEWTAQGKIRAEVSHAGVPLVEWENSMFTANAIYVLTAGDPTNATAAAIKAAKLNPTDLYQTDSNGYKFWASYPGGTQWSYFTDSWMMFYYLREAGLWTNFGQTTTPPGVVALTAEETTPTVLDEANLQLSAGLYAEEYPVVEDSEGWDLDPWGNVSWDGTAGDSAVLTVHVALIAEDFGTSTDSAVLSVADQPDIPPVDPPPVVLPVPADRWLWVSLKDGTEFELTGFVNGVAIRRGAAGIFAPPVRIRRERIPGLPGELTRDIYHGVRTLALPVIVHTDGLVGVKAAISELVLRMDPVTNAGFLRFVEADGYTSDLFCQCIGGLEGAGIGDMGPNAHSAELVFEAEDPYFYGPSVSNSFGGGAPQGWFPIIRANEPWLGGSSVIGSVQIETSSDVETWPVWTIIGPASDPVLSNQTTGRTLAMTASVANGDSITIDTRPRGATARTVLGPGGENWFGKLTKRALWSLQPGVNQIDITVDSATPDSYVSLTYRDAKLLPWRT